MHIGYIISSGIFYLSMCGDTICILQLLKNVYIYIYIYDELSECVYVPHVPMYMLCVYECVGIVVW